MINEKNRESFLNVFTPPSGWNVDFCVGTTFSMDLSCLTQLAINMSGKKDQINDLSVLEVLNIVDDFTQKSRLFVQNCRIKSIKDDITVSSKNNKAKFFSLLDSMIYEVPSSDNGVFHPKVWLIKYSNKQRQSESFYKLFIMSKNLTSSIKWDVSSCLIGHKQKGSRNDDLKDFLKDIKKISSLRNKKDKVFNEILEELDHIKFIPPKGKSEFKFCYKSSEKKDRWNLPNFNDSSEIVILSPFLSKSMVKKIENNKKCILITSKKDIYHIDQKSQLFKNTYILENDRMDLHAKMYLIKEDSNSLTENYIGSSNFTHHGLNGENVEANIFYKGRKNEMSMFKDDFIYDERKIVGKDKVEIIEKTEKPWLKKISDFIVDIDMEDLKNESSKIDLLDEAQKILSQGEFELSLIHSKGTLKFNGDLSNWPKGVFGKIKIYGAEELIKITNELLEGNNFTKTSKIPISTIIEVSLNFNGQHKSFCTVAISNINKKSRNKALISQQINDLESFWEYVGVIIDTKNSNTTKRDLSKKGTGNKKSSKNKSSKRSIPRYIEPLLMGAVNEPRIVEKVNLALMALEKSTKEVSSELLEFKLFWKEFKIAHRQYFNE